MAARPIAPEPLIAGAVLPRLERWALFLDIDGTLIDIAPTPDSVTVPRRLIATLPALATRFSGALALVSGRALATMDRLFAPLRLTAAGQHGAEFRRRPEAPVESLVAPERIARAAELLRDLPARFPGIMVEEKGLSIAIHFRNAPEAAAPTRQAAIEAVEASDGALELLEGKMVWDLRPHHITKGTAIEMLMAEPPFAGRLPVMVGDDRTDEDGFAAAARLGGAGILVGPARPTGARFRLPDPRACRAWLAALARIDAREA
jgi:trehalose 6-phosphate phosphatase